MRTTIRGLALLLLTACVGLWVTAPSASAHSRLLSSSPADGSTVPASPSEVVLTFNEDINPQFVTVRVTDGEGGDVVGADAAVDGPRVIVPVGEPIAAGSYKVTYRVVSADSHPISGSTTFTIAGDPQGPPASASPSPSASRSPSDTSSSPSPTASPDAASTAASGPPVDTEDGTPAAVWVVVLLAVAAAVAATLYAVRRNRGTA